MYNNIIIDECAGIRAWIPITLLIRLITKEQEVIDYLVISFIFMAHFWTLSKKLIGFEFSCQVLSFYNAKGCYFHHMNILCHRSYLCTAAISRKFCLLLFAQQIKKRFVICIMCSSTSFSLYTNSVCLSKQSGLPFEYFTHVNISWRITQPDSRLFPCPRPRSNSFQLNTGWS